MHYPKPNPTNWDRAEAKKRIKAQFATMRAKGKKFAILSAFGCGAFNQPGDKVAQVYKEVIEEEKAGFAGGALIFAIISPYGPQNQHMFAQVLSPTGQPEKLEELAPITSTSSTSTTSCNC